MNVAIIAAAGQGKRMGAGRERARAGGEPKKIFLELNGTRIIIHTLRRFEQCADIDEVFVVLPATDAASFLTLAAKYGLRKLKRIVTGGATRPDSVWGGLRWE